MVIFCYNICSALMVSSVWHTQKINYEKSKKNGVGSWW